VLTGAALKGTGLESVKAKRTNRSMMPLDADEARLTLLSQMGFTAADLQKARQRIVESLDAEKVEYFADKGHVTDERTVVDYKERRAAANDIVDVFGIRPRGGQASPPEVVVEVTVADWVRRAAAHGQVAASREDAPALPSSTANPSASTPSSTNPSTSAP